MTYRVLKKRLSTRGFLLQTIKDCLHLLRNHPAMVILRVDRLFQQIRCDQASPRKRQIWEWQYPEMDGAYPRPADIAIRQEKGGRGDSYICDLNDIQVFSGPVVPGGSLLLSRESFLRVFFKECRKGVFVNAETSEVSESKTLVDLKLSFERAVEVAFPTIVRIAMKFPPVVIQAKQKTNPVRI